MYQSTIKIDFFAGRKWGLQKVNLHTFHPDKMAAAQSVDHSERVHRQGKLVLQHSSFQAVTVPCNAATADIQTNSLSLPVHTSQTPLLNDPTPAPCFLYATVQDKHGYGITSFTLTSRNICSICDSVLYHCPQM